ncbi:TonB-dependent receptor [Bacteroides sp. OttesenSCG-928-E20]|nr:TonB-dependent receptor [Bacteroides sp. OttesenSCG-928-N06]MDL2299544.1 TonB-dependent receptor [Bacteroides sp. OttesenSCG-928-E20]
MKQVNLRIYRMILPLLLGMFLSLGAYAQTVSVKGHVKDAFGEPVIGANVVVKGSSVGTITDIDGNFTLNAPLNSTIEVSFIGYKTVEVQAAASVMVTLQDDTVLLEEAVIIGYGTVKKNDLTGSVTAIKPDEKNRGMVTNPQDMMQGKIAGVNVTTGSGSPGTGATIRIRGGSSLNASNDPLIVIDGLAMDNQGVKGLSNPLSMVNPADIETFTVLKDASATAIYGSRGSNGVIIITTKKGIAGKKPSLSYNGNVSLSMKKNTIDVMNADEYRSFITDYYGVDSEAYNKMGKANTNWQDEIYRTAISHDHNVTLSGGIKDMPYRLSLGFTDQQGILDTSDFERYTLGVNFNPTFFDKHLKVNINAKGMIAKTRYADTGAISAATRMDPTQSVYSDESMTITNPYTSQEEVIYPYRNYGGYFQWLKVGGDYKDEGWPMMSERNAVRNPVSMLQLRDSRANSKSLVGNLELDYTVHGFEDLRLHMNFGMDLSTGKQDTYESPMSSGSNAYYGWDGWEKEEKYNLSYNAYAQYTKDFTSSQHFDIMAGYEWQHVHYEGSRDGSGMYPLTNMAVDDSGKTLAGTPYNRSFDKWKSENYLVSFFGRANYSLLDRYLLTATVRYDGSSRFKEHWALFPSFAFGWKINNEAFMENVEFISDLKLRLGYGQTGQQEGIGDYNYFASYNVNTNLDSYYPILGDGALNRPNAYNMDLTWETTTTYNVGLDFGIMNNILSGSVDYYYRETTDLLNTVYVAAGSNFRNQVTSNIGSLENTGVEFALTYRPLHASKNWNWEITANATYNKNEITELIGQEGYYVATGGISSGTGNNAQAHAVGHPASSFYVYQQVYDADGKPIENAYVDRDGNGIINQDDRYFYKSPVAPWTAGFSSRLSYKNWDFGFSLRASFDNYVFNDAEAGFGNIDKTYDNSFGYLQNRPLSAIKKGFKTYDSVLSDYYVQNASFLKCDNITLGYSFNNLLKSRSYNGISGRVFATASNVFTITNYTGVDPEVFGGIDNNIYPRPFSLLFGLNLNF